MMFSPKPESLGAVPLDALHDFLVRRGWVQKPSTNSRLRYYEHAEMFDDEGRRMWSYIPASDRSSEYPSVVHEFIHNQAQFWDLAPEAVYAELTGGPLAEPVRTSVPA